MVSTLDRWDVALLAIAAYVAVVSLARLMRVRRDQLIRQFRNEVELEHNRQALLARARGRGAAPATPSAKSTSGRGS